MVRDNVTADWRYEHNNEGVECTEQMVNGCRAQSIRYQERRR